MKTGIFGGTFDPVHMGHLIMAEQARDEAGLDEVWFIPASQPPHKPDRFGAAAKHRFRMAQLAVEGVPGYTVSAVEMERTGLSYTVDTVRTLAQSYPDREFFFILGADMVLDLPNWYRIKEILDTVRLLGLVRQDYDLCGDHLPPSVREKLTLVRAEVRVDLSSTLVRERIKQGRSVRFLVPEAVRLYMEEHRLYESG